MTKGKTAYDFMLQELKILQKLEHPNILWLQEIIDSPLKDNLYLVTEFHANGSVVDLLNKINGKYADHNSKCKNNGDVRKRRGLKTSICRLFLIDMLKALYYCHKIVKIVHRDIKPENIMINHNNEAVLIDFGVSALKEC